MIVRFLHNGRLLYAGMLDPLLRVRAASVVAGSSERTYNVSGEAAASDTKMQHMPVQALWQLAAVSKSTVYARQEAAAAILSSAKRHSEADAGVQRLLQRFPEVVDQLIRLCNHTSGDKR